ncbi:MAG TPA: hypothetical protein VGM19_00810 [Armatimonadota bacterium]|jgi:hypothetical protein
MSKTIMLVALLGLLVALALPALAMPAATGTHDLDSNCTVTVQPWASVVASTPTSATITTEDIDARGIAAQGITGTPGSFTIKMNTAVDFKISCKQLWTAADITPNGHPEDQLKTEYQFAYLYLNGGATNAISMVSSEGFLAANGVTAVWSPTAPAGGTVPTATCNVNTASALDYKVAYHWGLDPTIAKQWQLGYNVIATNVNNDGQLPSAATYSSVVKCTIAVR